VKPLSVADSSPRPARVHLAEVAAKSKAEARIGVVVSGRYRIVELLAMGGVGVVYKGEHVHMHKWVAIKVLHPDAQDAPDLVARFQREAVAGAHVQHPNVAAATDFGELEDGSFFLVLEYVRGATLREIVGRGALSPTRAARIAKQIAAALSATHAIGIVHRDVTPRNIMLAEGERDMVKLIDFGLAKVDPEKLASVGPSQEFGHDITGTGAVFGTIAYLAPEVSRGMDLVDARADLYALGLVFYEMLCGKHPFDTTDAVELFKRHATVKPMPLGERVAGVVVPAALEAVVMRLLEKAPEDRFGSADAVIEAIDAALDGTFAGTPMPAPVVVVSEEMAYPGPSIPPPPVVEKVAVIAPVAPVVVIEPVKAAPILVALAKAAPRRAVSWWGYAAVSVAALGVAGGLIWWVTAGQQGGGATATSNATATATATASANATASATATASANATATASAAAASAGRVDPVARGLFRKSVVAHDYQHASEPFFALVDHDPEAFRDVLIAAAAKDFAVAVASVPGEEGEKIFDALGHRVGGDGLDVLYEIARTRGGSKGADKALALLGDESVMSKASPELKVTWEILRASCADKAGMLDRAASEGDVRTLMVLESAGRACLRHNQALEDAIKTLKLRVTKH
jgi:eukaryotic-like serine/threonine-protein kinase